MDVVSRSELADRIHKLCPDHPAQWGWKREKLEKILARLERYLGMTNKQLAIAPLFVELCEKYGVKPTARQAAKFKQGGDLLRKAVEDRVF